MYDPAPVDVTPITNVPTAPGTNIPYVPIPVPKVEKVPGTYIPYSSLDSILGRNNPYSGFAGTSSGTTPADVGTSGVPTAPGTNIPYQPLPGGTVNTAPGTNIPYQPLPGFLNQAAPKADIIPFNAAYGNNKNLNSVMGQLPQGFTYNPNDYFGTTKAQTAIANNSNLTPTALGTTGSYVDRLGNTVAIPMINPITTFVKRAAGGLVGDEEDDDKESSGAKQMMKGYEQLTGPRQTQVVSSPNAQSVRSRQASQIVDKQGRPAGMSMTYESMSTAQGPSQASPEQMATAKAMLSNLMRQNMTKRRFADGGEASNFTSGASAKAGAPVKMQAGGLLSALLRKAAPVAERKVAQEMVTALPAAERLANLEKFLSRSYIKDPVYHATPKDITVFKPGGDDPTMSGRAIWTTTSKTNQPAQHNIGSKTAKYREGVNVMPLHGRAERPLLLDDPDMVGWAQDVFAGGSREFPELLPDKWLKEVKEAGYDSVILADPHKRGDPHEVIFFEPNQLKSALSNRGTYDINEAEIMKADGGLVYRADGGYVAPTNPFGKQAAKQKAMREEQGLTPAGALLRGLGQGMYGDVGNGMGDRGYSVMDPASNAKPGREAEMQRYQDIGTALGIGSDAVPFMAMASKPLMRGAKSLATSDTAYDMLNKVLGATGGGPKYLIIGPNAKTWNKPAADLATQMEKQGKNGDEIWQATGTFRAADGKWRQEISDANMKYTPANVQQRQFDQIQKRYDKIKDFYSDPKSLEHLKEWYEKAQIEALSDLKGSAGEFIDHPALKEAYPQLSGYKFRDIPPKHQDFKHADSVYGYFDPKYKTITMNSASPNQRSSVLHELQHAIQDIEGWTGGTNKDYALYRMKERELAKMGGHSNDLILEQTAPLEGYTDPSLAYKNLSGEVEARLAQKRKDLDEFIRKNRSPIEDYDVDPSQQITKEFAKGGAVTRADGSPKSGETAPAPRLTDLEKLTQESKKYPQYNDLMDFLASRQAVPEITQTYLGPSTGGQFISGWGEPKNGRIELNYETTPSTLLHELTHAADRQISHQASDLEERHRKETPLLDYLRGKTVLTPEEVRLAMGYRKLHYDPKKDYKDPARYPRQQLISKMAPEWAKENYDYRSGDGELVAYGMGSTVPRRHNRAPLHVDPTMATEFSILLDLAQRAQKAKPPTKK